LKDIEEYWGLHQKEKEKGKSYERQWEI